MKFKVKEEDIPLLKSLNDSGIDKAINDGIINMDDGIALRVNNIMIYKNHEYPIFNTVSSDYLLKISKKFNKQCFPDEVDEFEFLPNKIIGGYKCKVISKGKHIFKAIPAILTKDRCNEYVSMKPDNEASWFADEKKIWELCSGVYWMGYPYLVTDDIYLVDDFDIDNYRKYISEIDNEQLIKEIKYRSSVDSNIFEALIKIVEMNQRKWSDFWIYTEPFPQPGLANKCNNLMTPFSKMYTKVKKFDEIDQNIIKFFFNKSDKKIDGLMRYDIFCYFENNGIMTTDEYIINGNAMKNKLKLDTSHPMYYGNWNFKIPIPKANFSYGLTFSKLSKFNRSNNESYKGISFWEQNNNKLPEIKGSNLFMTYNLHNFRNISDEITVLENINNILNLVKKYSSQLSYIIFQEVFFPSHNYEQNFVKELQNLGFIYYHWEPNGGKKATTRIYVFSKNYCRFSAIKFMDKKNIYRNSILCGTNICQFVATHLAIGESVTLFDNEEIIKSNSEQRTFQLKHILKFDPDMICGDFNFAPRDLEKQYLEYKGYYLISKTDKNTTPHNCVDMFFAKKHFRGENFQLIHINYSDHLPVIIKLINK